MVRHPWDQTLGAPCHVPGVSAAGARAADGARWIAAHPRFLCPVRALRPVLRGQCLDALAPGGPRKALSCAEEPPDRATGQAEHATPCAALRPRGGRLGQGAVCRACPGLGRCRPLHASQRHRAPPSPCGGGRPGALCLPSSSSGQSRADAAARRCRMSPPLPVAGVASRLQASPAFWLARHPVQGARPAPLPGTAGPARRATPTPPQAGAAEEAREHGNRPHAMAAVGRQAPRAAPAVSRLEARCQPGSTPRAAAR